jgi:hypothetical protein
MPHFATLHQNKNMIAANENHHISAFVPERTKQAGNKLESAPDRISLGNRITVLIWTNQPLHVAISSLINF